MKLNDKVVAKKEIVGFLTNSNVLCTIPIGSAGTIVKTYSDEGVVFEVVFANYGQHEFFCFADEIGIE